MEKKITPILLIVVLFVALFSTYAWFSDLSKTFNMITMLESGVTSSFSLGTAGSVDEDRFSVDDLNIEQYQGQMGYKADGSGFNPGDADYLYTIDVDLPYLAKGTSNAKFILSLAKVELVLDRSHYNYTKEQTLQIVAGLDTTGFTEADYTRYFSSSPDELPGGIGASQDFYFVYSDIENRVTHIVIKGVNILETFEFDYWKSSTTKINHKADGYESALQTGILLNYGEDLTNAGTLNYVGIYIGFCSLNKDVIPNIYNKPFKYCDEKFQGAMFNFTFNAGMVNA